MKAKTKDIALVALGIALIVFIVLYAFERVENHTQQRQNMEVERKFLVESARLPADMTARSDIFEFIQTYISYSPEMRVRKVGSNVFYYTMKLPQDEIGLERAEVEFRITQAEYEDLVQKGVGTTIHKKRYQFLEGSHLITVDIFSEDFDGLIYAEVEFGSVADSQKYTPPDWFGKEVTSDLRYKNASLARYGIPTD